MNSKVKNAHKLQSKNKPLTEEQKKYLANSNSLIKTLNLVANSLLVHRPLNKGKAIHVDPFGFKILDPETGKFERTFWR